jgi:vacuolar-type H+-ATPase subunit H
MASEELIDEITMHRQTISSDSNSPLQLIRERELEISGRMLSAKREADEIVTAARKKAAEIVAAAEAEGGAGAREREQVIVSAAEKEAAELKQRAMVDANEISSAIAQRKAAAVKIVVDAVSSI